MAQGLIILGTVGLDTIQAPRGIRRDVIGGSAAHCAMSARLFTEVHLCAVVGADFPSPYLTFFRRRGINTASLHIRPGTSFRWTGEYKPHDMNTACTLHTHLGVIADGHLPLQPWQQRVRHIFLANYDPDLQAAVLQQMRQPRLVGMDTMNLWIATKRPALKRLLAKADILFINEAEAKALSEENNVFDAAKQLSRHGPRLVIVKKGEHGSICLSPYGISSLPAFPVPRVLDPTGAGDTFAGGVMGYLACCRKITPRTLRRALAYGTLCSSINVEGYGMEKTARLTRSVLARRLKQYSSFFRF